jgi:hypothetical protein
MWHLGMTAAALIALLTPAAAEDSCGKFAWPLARERAWFAADDKPAAKVGETLAAIPARAFTLQLQPGTEAVFAMPPERKPRSERWFGGAIRFPAPERPGLYQVTLEEAWIDVVQDGRYVRSLGSTGRGDCRGLRKSIDCALAPRRLSCSSAASHPMR